MVLSTMTTASAEDAYVRYREDVYRFLLRRTGNHYDAEELAQQVFADATAALARAGAPRSMRAWLFAVAERRLVDELRRRARAARTAGMLAPRADDVAAEPLGAVEAALHRLPRSQRRIVAMRILEGRTYRDIARELGCNEAACKMRLSRALQRLRDDLALAS